MNSFTASCPFWLSEKLIQAGGEISFYDYMNLALNDTQYGAYASGNIKVGKKGDFATSPSLGSDFAKLLATQVNDWLRQLEEYIECKERVSLIELGPGEGDLTLDLINQLKILNPSVKKKLDVILIEANKGMEKRQRKKLKGEKDIPINWMTFQDLQKTKIVGVIIAHEVFDALPVERVIYRDGNLFRMGVCLDKKQESYLLKSIEMPMTEEIFKIISELKDSYQIEIPPLQVNNGWESEIHLGAYEWFKESSNLLFTGPLLIIDYAFEAYRYYRAAREYGTLISYKGQKTNENYLYQAGSWDITAHLCMETIIMSAEKYGWSYQGQTRQGQALLALGLAQEIYSLQEMSINELPIALEKRETLLRLVDPYSLGDFRWIVFSLNKFRLNNNSNLILKTKIFQEPN